ncbi:hypothetical protein TEA_022084 [Camellia sinensis var. sinensis]|uniref:Secreted protein n=1 Tax=Camellia sinensis var. sinensis TaxID=542762 RepID=A0A4S4D4X6_CAMSN|nr:hypothetical protein TEA_022084 [Camellia sinensis var. sinensis]
MSCMYVWCSLSISSAMCSLSISSARNRENPIREAFNLVSGHENLIRWLRSPTLLDLHDTIHIRHHHHEHRPSDGLDDDWSATAFHTIQTHDHKLPQRGLEYEDHDQSHLGEYESEEKVNHFRRVDRIQISGVRLEISRAVMRGV